jgi:hypothetical protein
MWPLPVAATVAEHDVIEEEEQVVLAVTCCTWVMLA